MQRHHTIKEEARTKSSSKQSPTWSHIVTRRKMNCKLDCYVILRFLSNSFWLCCVFRVTVCQIPLSLLVPQLVVYELQRKHFEDNNSKSKQATFSHNNQSLMWHNLCSLIDALCAYLFLISCSHLNELSGVRITQHGRNSTPSKLLPKIYCATEEQSTNEETQRSLLPSVSWKLD